MGHISIAVERRNILDGIYELEKKIKDKISGVEEAKVAEKEAKAVERETKAVEKASK